MSLNLSMWLILQMKQFKEFYIWSGIYFWYIRWLDSIMLIYLIVLNTSPSLVKIMNSNRNEIML